ncbi:hypothetical protein ENUP19_0370G0034 [Entamoeba nuttalli]|uniref:Uncharacterized protein n=2 Tax=Entamoeba nuttalli TaxID=412467 RepID=K2HIC0_ENTNP|nr:hypothetical protein ENU1_011280 [Entamoeba nuttalli P19]EKE42759.1 hypothetical protein ENU1_011280 [Entamoeba nuttalli P19]|eukprot:XP_008854908.1 hypothetical protein ENU1_011280 [Entamoeba nuttalli P19]
MNDKASYSCDNPEQCKVIIPPEMNEVYYPLDGMSLIVQTDSLSITINQNTTISNLKMITDNSISHNSIEIYHDDGFDNVIMVIDSITIDEHVQTDSNQQTYHQLSLYTNTFLKQGNDKLDVVISSDTYCAIDSSSINLMDVFGVVNVTGQSVITKLISNSESSIYLDQQSIIDDLVYKTSIPSIQCNQIPQIRKIEIIGDSDDLMIIKSQQKIEQVPNIILLFYNSLEEWYIHKDIPNNKQQLVVGCDNSELHVISSNKTINCKIKECYNSLECLTDEYTTEKEIQSVKLIITQPMTITALPKKISEVEINYEGEELITIDSLSLQKVHIIKGNGVITNCIIEQFVNDDRAEIINSTLSNLVSEKSKHIQLNSAHIGEFMDITDTEVMIKGTIQFDSQNEGRIIFSNDYISVEESCSIVSNGKYYIIMDDNAITIRSSYNPIWKGSDSSFLIQRNNQIQSRNQDGCLMLISTETPHSIVFDGEENDRDGTEQKIVLDEDGVGLYLCDLQEKAHSVDNNYYAIINEFNSLQFKQKYELSSFIKCYIPILSTHQYYLNDIECNCHKDSNCAFIFEDQEQITLHIPYTTRTIPFISANSIHLNCSNEIEIGVLSVSNMSIDSTIQIDVLYHQSGELQLSNGDIYVVKYLTSSVQQKRVIIDNNASVIIGGYLDNVVISIQNKCSLEIEGIYFTTQLIQCQIEIAQNAMFFSMENDHIDLVHSLIKMNYPNEHAIALSSSVSFKETTLTLQTNVRSKIDSQKYGYVLYSPNGWNETIIDSVVLNDGKKETSLHLEDACDFTWKIMQGELDSIKCLRSPFNIYRISMNEPIRWRKQYHSWDLFFLTGSVIFVLGFLGVIGYIFYFSLQPTKSHSFNE